MVSYPFFTSDLDRTSVYVARSQEWEHSYLAVSPCPGLDECGNTYDGSGSTFMTPLGLFQLHSYDDRCPRRNVHAHYSGYKHLTTRQAYD